LATSHLPLAELVDRPCTKVAVAERKVVAERSRSAVVVAMFFNFIKVLLHFFVDEDKILFDETSL